jgi:Outer membrane protein beta-barrel domain
MIRRILGVATIFTLILSGRSAAQNPGLPVINNGIATGLTLSGDVGFPNDAAGGGTAFGATGKVGLGPLGVSGSISRYKPDGGESYVSLGATANWKLFGGPLIPFAVNFQAGASRFKDEGATLWHFPVGLGFSARIPTTVIGVKPWIAPRIDISRVSGGGLSNTDTNFGFSAGIELNLLSGLGFHASYDYVKADGATPSIFGVGVHYGLNIPGL